MQKRLYPFFRKKIVPLFSLLSVIVYSQEEKSKFLPEVKVYNQGASFSSVTVDQNKNIWAGTPRNGLYFRYYDDSEPLFYPLMVGDKPALGDYDLQTMVTDRSGNVWIGHSGGFLAKSGGGIEIINTNTWEMFHLTPDANAKGLSYVERDGLTSRDIRQIAVDPYNNIWTAQASYNLTITDEWGHAADITTPGTFSYRRADDYDKRFISHSTWRDKVLGQEDPYFPYPAYTYNPPISKSPQLRTCQAISADSTAMWVSVHGYIPDGKENTFIPSRLMKYSLNAVYQAEYTIQDAGFGAGHFNAVYANNKNGVWVTSTVADQGFSVLKDGKWHHINDSDLIPNGARFNNGAIWGDKSGRIYLGSDKGLVIYNGVGDVSSINSYTLYTKDTTPSIRRNRSLPEMVSNNIKAGASQDEDNFWVATDKGMMSFNMKVPQVYHIENRNYVRKEILESGKRNYHFLTYLKKEYIDKNDEKDNTPKFAADGTQSSVFRIPTENVWGFYDNEKTYKVEIRKINNGILPDTPLELSGNDKEKYEEQYGKFISGIPEDLDEMDYVDIIYTHPKYITVKDIIEGTNYAEYQFIIWDKSDEKKPIISLSHPIRISIPPILLVHSVWTGINSLDKIESFFLEKGYTPHEIQKAWKSGSKETERPFREVAHIIPSRIAELKKKAYENKISAGKVNVIAHGLGGLYTRAYIEGIPPSPSYSDNDDINSLITVNTPHSGSPIANAVVDKRIITVGFNQISSPIPSDIVTGWETFEFNSDGTVTIGDIFSSITGAEVDKENHWGAKSFMLTDDKLSGSYSIETEFIKDLNSYKYLSNLEKSEVPIHAIATEFDICKINTNLCIKGPPSIVSIGLPARLAWPLRILSGAKFLMDFGIHTSSDVVDHLYKYETNDFIVPLSSMKGGLGYPHFSKIGGNIAHYEDMIVSDDGGLVNSSGAMAHPEVHSTILFLLKENLTLSDKSASFTKKGLSPEFLSYGLFPNFEGLFPDKNKKEVKNNSKIVIDPNSFANEITSGNEISFDVYQENLDKITLFCDFIDFGYFHYLEKSSDINFKNTFSFPVPDDFFGKFSITAYGLNEERLVAIHTIDSEVKLPNGLSLESIRFEKSKVSLYEKQNYTFELLGMFSDGVERRINDIEGVIYNLSDASIMEQTDNKTIKTIVPGLAALKASVNLLSAILNVKVEEDPVLSKSLVISFYPDYEKGSPVTLNWETYQEVGSDYFILERSENTDQNFTEINRQQAKGTIYEPQNYSFTDNTPANKVYYRLTLYNLDGEIVYTQIIELEKESGSLSTEEIPQIESGQFKIAPNPLRTNTGSIYLHSQAPDENVKINIYDLNGRLISTRKYSITKGQQKIDYEFPMGASKGIYLIQLQTRNYSKTLKLILDR